MRITLTWTANTEADLASYRIYTGRAPGQTTQQAAVTGNVLNVVEVEAPGTSVDVDIADGRLQYISMTAVDTTGNESAKSAELTQINKYTAFSA